MDSTFKYKPDKIKYLNNVDTLDNSHRKIVDGFEKERRDLPAKKKRLTKHADELKVFETTKPENITPRIIERKAWLKGEMSRLTSEINSIDEREMEYHSKVHEVVMDYYDIVEKTTISIKNDRPMDLDELTQNTDQEIETESESCAMSTTDTDLDHLNKIHKHNRKEKKPTKKRRKGNLQSNTDILDFFTGAPIKNAKPNIKNDDTTEDKPDVPLTKLIVKLVSNKASLFNDYKTLTDSVYNSTKSKRHSTVRICENCKIEKILIHNEGFYVCPGKDCGEVEHIIIESEVPNYKDPVQEKPSYPYKRLNHLQEWLSQLQAKESTDIPQAVYDLINMEIKKQRITNYKALTWFKMKSILKKLKLQKHYEHISFILSKITGRPPPCISRDDEEKIKNMFKEMQKPFTKYCPTNRTNFLSYSYVLRKVFQLLELDELAEYCTLLKNRNKLRDQDKLWEKICGELQWQFYPSI